MSQHDLNIASGAGAVVRADMNLALLALASQNSGATAPTATAPYMPWADITANVIRMRNAGDTGWMVAGTLDTDQVLEHSGTYTLQVRDYGKLVRCDTTSGAWTLSLFAVVAELEGWRCRLQMVGTGVNDLTIDPDSAELINGGSTLTGVDGDIIDLYCTGTAWYAVVSAPRLATVPKTP